MLLTLMTICEKRWTSLQRDRDLVTGVTCIIKALLLFWGKYSIQTARLILSDLCFMYRAHLAATSFLSFFFFSSHLSLGANYWFGPGFLMHIMALDAWAMDPTGKGVGEMDGLVPVCDASATSDFPLFFRA